MFHMRAMAGPLAQDLPVGMDLWVWGGTESLVVACGYIPGTGALCEN